MHGQLRRNLSRALSINGLSTFGDPPVEPVALCDRHSLITDCHAAGWRAAASQSK